MPILREGNFVLYGYALTTPSTLTLGEHMFPPDAANYYLCNTGNPVFQPDIPTPMPCAPNYGSPTTLDTTGDGVGIAASSPPPGFTLKTSPTYSPPILIPGVSWIAPTNNAGSFNMGGKFGIPITAGAAGSSVDAPIMVGNDDPLLSYLALLDPLAFAITAVNGFPFTTIYWGRTGGPSTATLGARITGGYFIVGFWWTIPARDQCGNPHTSRLKLVAATDDPGPPWERLDPDDPDAAPTPTITLVEPDHGPIAGGDLVTIRGSGFGDACTVKIDGVAVPARTVVDQNTITYPAPAHVAGPVDVTVTNEDGVVAA